MPIDVGEPQLGAGVGAFIATIARISVGQDDRSSRPVMSATQAFGRISRFAF
jgi:hypothetical protein